LTAGVAKLGSLGTYRIAEGAINPGLRWPGRHHKQQLGATSLAEPSSARVAGAALVTLDVLLSNKTMPAKETTGDPTQGYCRDVVGTASQVSQVYQLSTNSLWPLMGSEQVSDFLVGHYGGNTVAAQEKTLPFLDFYTGKGQLYWPVAQGAGQLPVGRVVHDFTGNKTALTHQFSGSSMVFAKLLQGVSSN
jgi:hypothetical protein